jgi:hypothetical protein
MRSRKREQSRYLNLNDNSKTDGDGHTQAGEEEKVGEIGREGGREGEKER